MVLVGLSRLNGALDSFDRSQRFLRPGVQSVVLACVEGSAVKDEPRARKPSSADCTRLLASPRSRGADHDN